MDPKVHSEKNLKKNNVYSQNNTQVNLNSSKSLDIASLPGSSEHHTFLNTPVQGYYSDNITNSTEDDILSPLGGLGGNLHTSLSSAGAPSVLIPSLNTYYTDAPTTRVAVEIERKGRALPIVPLLSMFMGNLIKPMLSGIFRRPNTNSEMGSQKDAI